MKAVAAGGKRKTGGTSAISAARDSIEAEIEGVGMLRNHVVPWAAAHSTPPYSTDLYSSTHLTS